MGLGKTYSTKYLVDSNNNTGAVGEVLVSTATGINWANGSDIVGGPYLPLAGGTMTGTAGIIFPDDFKLNFGTGSDLEIYHNGNDSYIQDSGTGDLRIISSATKIYDADSSHLQATFTDGGSVDLYYGGNKKFETTSTGATVSGALAVDGKITNLTAGTGNLDAVNVQQLNDATTGALIFKGTWSAAPTTTSTLDGGVSTATIVIDAPNTGISVGATITGTGISGTVIVSNIAADGITIAISSSQTIADGVTLTFTTVGGIPDLSQTARKVTGDYYICETAGVATPNGTGTTPDDWAVGDWVAFSDLATDAWQKIDNSSVLSGAGTGGTVPIWAGSGTSVTLADAPITVSGSDTTFAGDVLVEDNLYLTDAGTVRGKIQLNSSDRDNLDIKAISLGSLMRFYTVDTLALTLDASQNATFAGDITSAGLTVDYTGNRTGDAGILVTNDGSDWGIKVDKDGVTDYGILSQTDGENAIVVRNAAGVNKIQLQGDGDATFASTVTATTFSGDLNGTINTATTGATQTAGDNSTLIATTAYADAAAAAVPIGDYLPLAGGTLTGGLVGTTGNFSGAVNALYFRTAAANSEYSLLTRDSTGNALFVQNAQSGTDQNIAIFQYGSAAVNQGTTVLQVAKDKSYFANCNVGIGTTSPGAFLDVQPTASNRKVTKIANDVTSTYVYYTSADAVLAWTCGSYHQAEVVITANQTNGGTYNNIYIRGIWSNNHTSHHWDELERIGYLTGSTFTMSVGQDGATTNSGRLELDFDYVSGSFSQVNVRVTDFFGTHSYTIT